MESEIFETTCNYRLWDTDTPFFWIFFQIPTNAIATLQFIEEISVVETPTSLETLVQVKRTAYKFIVLSSSTRKVKINAI